MRRFISDEEGLSRELTRLIILIVIIGGLSTAGAFAYNIYLAPPSAKVGVVTIDDTVYNFEYVHQIEDALDDDSIKAVVVKFRSPGGSANACFQTEESLSTLVAEKPVVADLEEYAASGAYLIASASDYIYAHSQTVTAGLGVMAKWVSYEDYYENKGIDYFIWKSGEQKDWFAPWRDPTENEIAKIENLVDDYANELFERIINNRAGKVPDNKEEFENRISDLKDGSIVYGSDALTYGLVDNLGDYNNAVEKAATMAGLEDGEYQVVNLSK
ncbi:hypothetical protein AKJ35_00110 [candidate division MSBL1 archaeon SCGC-AAA833F18]|uniref:Peptidase S49 domain-containing protein n=2 Tax=candidate division MSBL1 TaxID=215777 RepID=A0A133VT78_9EURY|nr:hypothetical protein AKJ47_02455 [candidate division MSBL1 archaeon SCGC-AAA261G05]KXB09654.1 hypothetical protein AKJ35_00110 [candidate division MSBL1 archaeon SCGC-AAA833F18]